MSSTLRRELLRDNLRKVVHTGVRVSPKGIVWYRPNGSEALRVGK